LAYLVNSRSGGIMVFWKFDKTKEKITFQRQPVCCKTQNFIMTLRYLKPISFLLLIFSLAFIACTGTPDPSEQKPNMDLNKILNYATSAKSYCRNNNLNTHFFILADLGRHSGLNRFFVWDFDTDQIIQQCLVSHGCGSNPWGSDTSREKPEFSNMDNSHCSSLGKYTIGERGYSQWGIHVKYLLHGLDATNSNALRRVIVLHSWDSVAEQEPYPRGTPEGWVAPLFPMKI
jgi:hypothetical protein